MVVRQVAHRASLTAEILVTPYARCVTREGNLSPSALSLLICEMQITVEATPRAIRSVWKSWAHACMGHVASAFHKFTVDMLSQELNMTVK